MLSHFICANVRHRAGNKEYEKLFHFSNDHNDFGYDSAGRLVSFERDTNFTNEQTDADWTLDGVGNWETLERTINSSPISRDRTANTFNEYTMIHTTAQTHDLNGNLTASGFVDYYCWDGLNRLSILRDDDLWPMYETTYLYTADNRRVGKINGVYNTEYIESFTEFALAGWQVLHEIDLDMSGNGQEENVRTFVYGNYIDEPLRMENLEHDYYYDYQNPPSAADGWVPMHNPDTDPTDPYGQHLTFTDGDADGEIDFSLSTDTITRFGPSTIANPYTFTGRRVDEETGLLYYRMRPYSVSRGRFLSRDPIGAEFVPPQPDRPLYMKSTSIFYRSNQTRNIILGSKTSDDPISVGIIPDGPNIYQYVCSNPILNVDPLGLMSQSEFDRKCNCTKSGSDRRIKQLTALYKAAVKAHNLPYKWEDVPNEDHSGNMEQSSCAYCALRITISMNKVQESIDEEDRCWRYQQIDAYEDSWLPKLFTSHSFVVLMDNIDGKDWKDGNHIIDGWKPSSNFSRKCSVSGRSVGDYYKKFPFPSDVWER